ncbi:MAG: glycosyltransferase 87 family protein [Thermoanaerobaculia bacterium]
MKNASSKRPGWLPWILAVAAGAAAATWIDDAPWRVLASTAAVAVLAVRRLPGRFAAPAARTRLLLLLAVASTVQATAPSLWRFTTSPWVRVWNVYHYYLGSKYFPELGYHDLYAATLVADREENGYWSRIRKVRDLRTYEVISRQQALDEYRPDDHFSDARWRDFRRDVRALQTQRSPRRWQGIFRDRGYNPPPVWTAVGRALTWLPADKLWSLKLLCALDLGLLAATFWLIARTFGVRAMACVLLLLTLSPVNEGRLVGGFLQYDWFCAIAAGFCFLRRRRAYPAAALFAYAVGTRVFPIFLLLSATVPLAYRWVRSGFVSRRDLRLLIALTGFGILAFATGTAGGGLDSWRDFAANIGHHNDAHRFGRQRIGLAHAFTRDVGGLDFREQSTGERRELFARQKNLLTVSGAILLAAWLAVVVRRSVPDALLLGLVPFFVLAVSSRYYWSCLALLPLLARPGPGGQLRVRRLTAAQASMFAVLGLVAWRGFERFSLYSVFDLVLAALLTGVLVTYLLHDLRVRRRHRPHAKASKRA